MTVKGFNFTGGLSKSQANGSYVQVLGASSGSDDTATLNALLAAGGRFRGTAGQTYKISAPLVIPSASELDMTGATVSLNAASNCNMFQNKSVTPVVTGTDGAIASGSAVLTSPTLAAVAAAGQTVHLAAATTNGFDLVANVVSVNVGANTVTLAKTAGATIVSGATAILYNRDTNIRIRGGTWQRNNNGGAGVQLHSMLLRHIDGLTVEDVNCQATAGKYFIAPGDCTNVVVQRISGAVNSSFCQANGPLVNFTFRDFFGTSGDDSVALTPSDYLTYTDTMGDITDGLVENVYTVSGSRMVNVLGGNPDTALRRVKVQNLHGQSTAQPAMNIGDDPAGASTIGGLVDLLTVDNVDTTVPNNQVLLWVNGTNIRRLRLRNLGYDNPNGTNNVVAFTATGGTLASVIIEGLNCVNTAAASIIRQVAAAAITRLTLRDISVSQISGATHPHVLEVNGSITDCMVRDTYQATTTNGYTVQLNASTAAITRLTFSGAHLNASAGLLVATNSAHVLPNVEVVNCTLNGAAWIADLNTTTEMHLSSVTHKSAVAGGWNIRANAVVTLAGDGNNITTRPIVTAGGKCSVKMLNQAPANTAGGFPTIAAGAGLGSAPTVAVTGSDRTGSITLTPGTGPAAGAQGTITYIGAWNVAPGVVLTPTNAAAQAAGAYVSAKSTTAFTISTANTPGGSMTFDYLAAF